MHPGGSKAQLAIFYPIALQFIAKP